MLENEHDPLDELIVSADVVEGEYRKLLAELLKPYVRIDPETGSIHFIKQVGLKPKQHILLFLLAKLALASKKTGYPIAASAKEVEEGTRLPGGTIRPQLRNLLSERVISQGKEGYFVEARQLSAARALLEVNNE